MIDTIDNYLIGIAIGIRYRANFSIDDQLGQIVDQILYSRDSFFDAKVFPEVDTGINAKKLFNKDTNDSLLINNSNIILEINFKKKFKKEDVPKIISMFEAQIIEGIMKKFKITEINRAGFVKRYVFDMEDLAKTFINKTIGQTLEGVNDINLQFSKKFPTEEALIKKNVLDYSNVIFSVVKKADKKELYMAVDYQKYFDPFLVSVQGLKFNQFIINAHSFNSKNYLEWLNKNYSL